MAVEFNISKTSTAPLVKKFPFLFRYAVSSALNDTAFQVRKRWGEQMRRVFDKPRPYTSNSGRVMRRATKDNLSVLVGLEDTAKGGTAPDKYLAPQIYGGPRAHKRFEKAILNKFPQFGRNVFFVPARGNNSILDSKGDLRSRFVTTMLSHLQAFGEQGYKANIKNPKKSLYFPIFRKGDFANLPPGIYKRDSVGSKNFEAVLIAVRQPQYRKRFYYFESSEKTIKQTFGPSFSRRFQRMAAKQVKEYNLTNEAILRRGQVAGRIRKIQASPDAFRPGSSLVLR